MQSAEKPQSNGPGAAVSSPTQRSAEPPAPAETPLLAREQIAQLQKILRSMDRGQLQSVLAALEPNVLRLCLHAIFGARAEDNPASAGTKLATHAKILAQTRMTSGTQSANSDGEVDRRRLSPRTPTQRNAKIFCPADELTIDCLILDKSESGALIFLDHSGTLPDTFDLYDVGDQKSGEAFTHLPHKKCKPAWRKRNKIGVTFVA